MVTAIKKWKNQLNLSGVSARWVETIANQFSDQGNVTLCVVTPGLKKNFEVNSKVHSSLELSASPMKRIYP